ncbi:nicotinamidase-related amidase [Microbacterium halimionae]|uniref:Nicotinamidase-related amidase n=1 Tax=Microbacterium halimionae TaxID=1526413 RepID=A0A7W3JPC4_9MICO|nr:isochorismatase family protein [Microbacterium halimionae]MBA8816550.1 nicotinamidase-related amidase [Microbacterium halimionae]NII95263.1 nicotinamidase-related amidase [Microbacterium halimionae]
MATANRALVLVDIQQEYFSGPLEIQFPSPADSLPKIIEAIDAAEANDIPVVVVQHADDDEAPFFNPTLPGFALHPEIETRRTPAWKSITKQYGSVFAGTDLLEWLKNNEIETVTLVGYMTNNCIISSAAEAEVHGIAAEVLSDATGAISIGNDAGYVDAKTVHTTLMALMNSNFAAVEPTDIWIAALSDGHGLEKDNLPASAMSGAQRFSS